MIAVLALAGCSGKGDLEPQHAAFLEGFAFGWADRDRGNDRYRLIEKL